MNSSKHNKDLMIKLINKNGQIGILSKLQTCVSLYVLVLFITVVTNAEETCQSDWSLYNSRCYQIVVGRHTYEQALQNCNNSNGTLASVPDNNTLQFLTSQIYQKWKSRLHYHQCEHAIVRCNGTNLCTEIYSFCLHFWVGMYSAKTCEDTNCLEQNKREDWVWMDGSVYNPATTPWADGKPDGIRNPIRLGILNYSMMFYLADQANANFEYGYICSKESQIVEEEGTTSGMTQPQDTSLIIGLAAGLGGGVLLIIIIAGLIILIVDTRKKRKNRTRTIFAPTASTESDYKGSLYPYGSHLTTIAPNKPNLTPYIIEPYSQSSTLGLSIHSSVGNTKTQQNQIEPYSQISTLGISKFSTKKIEPYVVTQEVTELDKTSTDNALGDQAEKGREDMTSSELYEYANTEPASSSN